MAEPNLLPGTRFRVYRNAGTLEFVCIGTTADFTRNNQFEDATVNDCDNPTAIPWRKSVKKSREWALNFSGTVDAAEFGDLRDDVDAELAIPYRIVIDPASGGGGGQYDGLIHFDSLAISKQENGIVKFTSQARGDGAVTWTGA